MASRMLEVVARSHRGRICACKNGDESIQSPCAISREGPVRVSHDGRSRIFHFMGSEIALDPHVMPTASSRAPSEIACSGGICVARLPFPEDMAIPDGAEVVVVPNAFELRGNPRKLVDSVMRIREAAGSGRLLCMLGIAEPSTVALLSYMGVDLFDGSLAEAAGMHGILLMPEGEALCQRDASAENLSELERECAKVRMFISAGRLRELADQRAPSSPASVAALRIFDDIGHAYQEEACPTAAGRFACNTTQALRRPDLRRFRERMGEYRKPAHKRVLLLLPCSARKPYHTSKTHKAFASAIHTARHDTLVHEVIVTSPLGLVPRELDVFYPANSYDIPVTGEWKCEEKAMIRSMLSGLISQGYDSIICHMGDCDAVGDIEGMRRTAIGDPASPASLKSLDSALREATRGMEAASDYTERREAVRSVLAFQFGREAADLIMDEDTYAIGKFPYWKIIREDPADRQRKIQLGMLTPERGMVSLTLEGAAALAGRFNTVEMTDFDLKGNLFAVGVAKADHAIRAGDEAVVVRNGAVEGVGVAEMPGREMEELKRSIAVKIRHKRK